MFYLARAISKIEFLAHMFWLLLLSLWKYLFITYELLGK